MTGVNKSISSLTGLVTKMYTAPSNVLGSISGGLSTAGNFITSGFGLL